MGSSIISRYNLSIPGVTLVDTPLVQKALQFARENVDDFTYRHVLRCWLFGSMLLPLITTHRDEFDHESFAIATILHDLGWNLSSPLVSMDKRFEVDGAIGAREFLAREAPDWDEHRKQLVWDAIALHATPSIAMYKEPVVVATCRGITADVLGPGQFDENLLSREIFEEISRQIPREGFKEGLKEVFCALCRTKPGTTYDNFVGEYGEKYVAGYSREGRLRIDVLEGTP